MANDVDSEKSSNQDGVALREVLDGGPNGSGPTERPAALTQDEVDIARWGKKQQMKRNFGLLSITGLTCTLMLTWEAALIGIQLQFVNGGPTGCFAGYIFAWIGTIAMALVMAEMASMVPLSGGQYNWVAVLAPPSCSKFLSYMTGWMTMVAWQSGGATLFYLSALIIQITASITHPGYQLQNWQTTLMMYALIVVAVLFNTVLARLLPKLESIVLLLHVAGFFVVLIVIVYLTPHKRSAHEVFENFVNGGGWPTNGLSFFVGAVGSILTLIGVDAGAHLSEEVQHASSVVPKAIVATVLINGASGLGMLVAFLFCMDPALSVLKTFSSGGSPFIDIFVKSTKSASGAAGLTAVIMVIIVIGCMGLLATSSRMIWAFARENALPGSKYFSRVSTRLALPLWAIALSVVITLVLALINIGSTTAFNAFAGLTVQGFFSVFIIAASVMLHKRLTTPSSKIHWGPFRLGVLGVPITIFSLIFTVIGFFFSFWPPAAVVTRASYNWAMVVYLSVVILSMAYWKIHAHKIYTGPIMEVSH